MRLDIPFKKYLFIYSSLFFLMVFLISCESNNQDFYVPKLPLNSGYEKLGKNVNANRNYKFELFKYQYEVSIPISEELYVSTTAKPKSILVKEDEKLSSSKFYNLFLTDNKDEKILKDIISQIENRSKGNEFDMVQVIVNFVQSIPYDEAEDQKYPIETLYLNKGDCSDKSVLLAKLLDLAGFNTCLFVYNNAKHMAVGVSIDDTDLAYKSGYIYIESTGYNPIGEIPKKFAGGIKINEEPEIITFSNASYCMSNFKQLQGLYKTIKHKYGENYFNTTIQGKLLLESISNLDIELKKSKNTLLIKNKEKLYFEKLSHDNGCSGTLESDKYKYCMSLQDSIERKYNQYNNLIDKYNLTTQNRNYKVQLINEINKLNYIKN
jgi:hypothetical protein